MTDTTSTHLASIESAGDAASFPTHAELVRTLLGVGGFGTLCTLTPDGSPYGSLAAYSVHPDGSPVLCISELAEHTRYARLSSSAGMFVDASLSDDPMDSPRVSIVGRLVEFTPDAADIERHLAAHPSAADYVDWPDFGWWRLDITSARYVGGFGTMGWVDGDAIAGATADPILLEAGPAVAHMNADHADANLDIVRQLAGRSDATAASVRDIDRRGITFYADTPDGLVVARVAFPTPLDDPGQIRQAVVGLTQAARGVPS